MFGIGMPEMILILAVALIVIGPKKLPDLAKSLGKAMGEFKRATSDLKESMQIDTELKEVKSAFDDIAKDDPKPAATANETNTAHKIAFFITIPSLSMENWFGAVQRPCSINAVRFESGSAFFLLTGGIYRYRALSTHAATVLIW